MKIKNKDIAKKLGISTTAVSLALNNRPGVSEETKRKVQELFNEAALHSIESMNAPESGTVSTSGHTILFSVHKNNKSIINEKPFFAIILETAQQEAMRHGCSMVITHYLPGQDIESYMKYLDTLSFDGLIIEATELDLSDFQYYKRLCDHKKATMILIDGAFDTEEVNAVELDNARAVYRAVRYAYSMGHKDIGYLKSSEDIMNFVHSHDGFWKGIRELELENYVHPFISLPPTMEEAQNAMSEFLKHMPADYQMPSLFIADLDYIAIGAMEAMKEYGYRIPEDISFIGYDDVLAASMCTPKLTTTRVNREDIGRLTIDRLLNEMEHPSGCYTTTQISSQLIERESVRRL